LPDPGPGGSIGFFTPPPPVDGPLDDPARSFLVVRPWAGQRRNLEVRKLVAGVINRDQLVKDAYGSYGRPTDTAYPQGILNGTAAPVTYPPSNPVPYSGGPEPDGARRRLAPEPEVTPG
jgi:ABC-type transport system substrate-binding protein